MAKLHDAAEKGDLAKVQQLLKKRWLAHSVDVNARNIDGNTPLYVAAAIGHLEVARLLIEIGADISALGQNGQSPLQLAVEKGHFEVAKLLIENGAEISAKDIHGSSLLLCAVNEGWLKVAKLLIESGAEVNAKDKDGETPLHRAAREGKNEVAKLLVESGAEVNARDMYGRTPLHHAAQTSSLELAKLLIESGADLNASCGRWFFGWTPLHRAAYQGKLEMARLLIESGASVNAKDNYGWTPFRHASAKDKTEVALLLIENGGNDEGTVKAFPILGKDEVTAIAGNLTRVHGRVLNVTDVGGALFVRWLFEFADCHEVFAGDPLAGHVDYDLTAGESNQLWFRPSMAFEGISRLFFGSLGISTGSMDTFRMPEFDIFRMQKGASYRVVDGRLQVE